MSGLNACAYCHGVHTATAQAFGVSEGTLGALLDDVGAAPVAERMKSLLRYVGKLTLTPPRRGDGAPAMRQSPEDQSRGGKAVQPRLVQN